MLQLHDDPMSTSCYSVRLLLSMLGLHYQTLYHNVETDSDPATRPRLEYAKQDVQIEGYIDILKYLALSHGDAFYPAESQTDINDWLAFAEILQPTFGQLRQAALAADVFLENEVQLQQQAYQQLKLVDAHLCTQMILDQQGIASKLPSIADLACFPLIALAWDAGVALDDYVYIRRWVNRIRHLPRFIPMPGLLAAALE